MLHYLHRTVMDPAEGSGSPITITTAGTAVLTLTPARPVRIIRYGVIVTTAITATSNNMQLVGNAYAGPNASGTKTTGSTVTFGGNSVYNASNAPTGYIDTAGGTCTVANANLSSLTAGVVLWHDVNPQAAQTGGYYPAPDTALIPPGGVSTQLVIYPGQSFQVVSANTMTAGAVIGFVEIEDQAFTADFNNNAMVVSGYPSTNGTTPTPSWPFAYSPVNAQA